MQFFEPAAGLHSHDTPPCRIGLDAKDLVELERAEERAAVVDDRPRHREHRTDGAHGRRKSDRIDHNRLHIGVADRLHVDGRPGLVRETPALVGVPLVFKQTLIRHASGHGAGRWCGDIRLRGQNLPARHSGRCRDAGDGRDGSPEDGPTRGGRRIEHSTGRYGARLIPVLFSPIARFFSDRLELPSASSRPEPPAAATTDTSETRARRAAAPP